MMYENGEEGISEEEAMREKADSVLDMRLSELLD